MTIAAASATTAGMNTYTGPASAPTTAQIPLSSRRLRKHAASGRPVPSRDPSRTIPQLSTSVSA